MAKVRPCSVPGCSLHAMKAKRSCAWHWLAKQPAAVQTDAARSRAALIPEAARLPRVPKTQWPEGRRWCSGCQTMVPLFYTSGSRCKACASAAQHGASVLKTYKMTASTYDELLRLQGGRCAICRAVPRSKRMAVDHDHETGENRGLLCSRCNHDLLGAAHDRVEILLAAVAYLEAPPTSGRWTAPSTTKPAPLIEEEDGPPPF